MLLCPSGISQEGTSRYHEYRAEIAARIPRLHEEFSTEATLCGSSPAERPTCTRTGAFGTRQAILRAGRQYRALWLASKFPDLHLPHEPHLRTVVGFTSCSFVRKIRSRSQTTTRPTLAGSRVQTNHPFSRLPFDIHLTDG